MTTGTSEPYAPAPPVETPAKNTFQRIAGVLFAPADTFRDIARKPDILVPLIILVITGFICTAILVPRMDFEAMMQEQMAQSGRQMSEADMERAGKMGAAFGKVMAWISPLLGVAVWAIIAGVLLLAHRLFGGEGNFKQAFSTTIYAWIPNAISGIVMTIVAAAKGEVNPATMNTLVKSSPAFLVDMKDNPILFTLLGSLDLFTIWTLILFIIGFSTLSRLSRGKSAAIVISLWLVTVIVKLGFAALGAAGMKKA
jgi:hypothetical protein